MFERAKQHISEGEQCLPTSHIFQHIISKHQEGIRDIKGSFKFEVVEKHRSAFGRQIAEFILIKNSKVPVMNNKYMYNRCIIPELMIKDSNEWKTREDQEAVRIKKLQLKNVRKSQQEEKKKTREKYIQQGGPVKKKRRVKKKCEKMISFKLTSSSEDTRKYYTKVLNEKIIRSKKITQDEMMKNLEQSILILESFQKMYQNEDIINNCYIKRKRKSGHRKKDGKGKQWSSPAE